MGGGVSEGDGENNIADEGEGEILGLVEKGSCPIDGKTASFLNVMLSENGIFVKSIRYFIR